MISDYFKKYKDPRWQKLRLEILQRENFKCQACGRTDEPLHVHHLWYDYSKDPWGISPALLECLCETCHGARREWDSIEIYHLRTRPTKDVINDEFRAAYLECMRGEEDADGEA